jgi:cytidyltransferase-like protein
MIKAVYPGTFDPLTRGHEDLVRRAATLFDTVVLAIADSKAKRPFFTLEERIAIAREVLADMKNVEVVGFSGLLTEFVRKQRARVVLARAARGVGLRVRVSARGDEPQPLSRDGDHLPHALRAAHVHLGDAGARDRDPRGRCLGVRAPHGRQNAEVKNYRWQVGQ